MAEQNKQKPQEKKEKADNTDKISKMNKTRKEQEQSKSKPRGRGRDRAYRAEQNKQETLEEWKPKTELGRKVKQKEILDFDQILDHSWAIREPEITDSLLELENELLLIGQSKGKFGGGARRVFRQTQKKTQEGNKPKFSTIAVVGDRNGHVGIGMGKAVETVPAREKAIRKAKPNTFKIRRGCGSWQCGCGTPHSIPFSVKGKCSSVEIKLIPAPKGTGLCCEKEIAKILSLAGIKDIWTKTRGQTKNKVNFIYACEKALKKLAKTKVQPEHYKQLAIADGSIEQAETEEKQESQKQEESKQKEKQGKKEVE